MFIVGLCIHIIFLFSIFDIYFKSPIVRDVPAYQPQHEALADRLVLFVVDGLRAESFIDYPTMKYMRAVARNEGRWGISSTRVPTESRPGHVAVIAGFYEDPSAVAKGWKENPVDFDSVFNKTAYTWCWGTYDILDIFTKGAKDDHIYVDKFDPYEQSFSTEKNTTLLDGWVFEHVKKFFAKAKTDESLKRKLMQNKIVFFLHLLGTDTAGHTHKPKTESFLTTLRFVDEGIKEIEKVFRDFYNDDGKTTFLMTSDHGMTDWGSHGAGDIHETETPYVIWGAGIKPIIEKTNEDILPERNKQDINQADLTPLMATVLSIPVPVNSIGQLPAELLSLSIENKAKAIYSNSRQLASQYDKKRLNIERDAIQFLYKPFEPFDKRNYAEMIRHTEILLDRGEYEKVILLSDEIMHLSLAGLSYYHNYYQRMLLILVTLSFIGWILCLLKKLMLQSINTQTDTMKIASERPVNTAAVFVILGLGAFYLVYAQNLPIQYYAYFLLPVFLWWYAMSPINVWTQTYRQFMKNHSMGKVVIEFLCYSLGSLAMGLCFTYRWTLSAPLLGMALWPLFSTARERLSSTVLISWSLSCCLLSAFTFMPVVGKKVYIELVVLAGLIWLLIYAIYSHKVLRFLYNRGLENRKEVLLSALQMLILAISLHNVYVQSKRFENGTPVSYLHQSLAWIIAVASLILPLAHSKRLVCRLISINTSIFTIYLLLSVLHEGLFLVVLMLSVLCWVHIESTLTYSGKAKILECTFDIQGRNNNLIMVERSVSRQDFRRAFFFLLYIIVAFFGTGNIASLNSFEVRWVTCFVTSFNPFLITGLVLMKTLAPFICVASCFRAVQHLTKAPTGYLNIIVLVYSNIMGIQLLYYVRNTGSWLDIGTSISQFVIVQVITLFIVLIHQIAKLLTDVNLFNLAEDVFRRKKYV